MDLAKIKVKKLSVNVFHNEKTRSSFCWKYFGHLIITEFNKKKIVNAKQVYCLACLTAVQKESEDITFGAVKIKCYTKTVSTGNLIRHLRDNHQIHEELPSAEKVKTNIKEFARPAKTCSTSSTKGSRNDKWLLAKDLALWFCKSLLPFDSVCEDGMVDFFKKYNIITADDEIPSRYTVSGPALTDVYESMLDKVKNNIYIDAAMHFAITFDFWTDQYRGLNYITFTLHYLTSDFMLKAFTLSTEIISGQKTVEKINDAMKDIRKRFLLDDKNIVAVTDPGEKMNQAVSLANMTHHLCLGHGLHNLVTVDGINSVPETASLVQKCKKIVKTLRYHAPEFQAEAAKVQLQLEFLGSLDRIVEIVEYDEGNPIPEIDLSHEDGKEFTGTISPSESGYLDSNIKGEIVDCKHIPTRKTATLTRWHSVLEMLESVIHVCNRDPINEMLRQIDQEELRITKSEWILLEDLVKFLKSFREVVQIMSTQITCTINVALVFRSEITDVLNALKDDESVIMLRLKRNMLANINKRFPVTKVIVAAALLDNRFMSLKEIDTFLENRNMTRTSFLSSYIREVISVADEPAMNLAETSATGNTSTDPATSLLHKLSKKHSIRTCQGTQDDPIEQETWRYIASADPTEPKDGNLLAYWNMGPSSSPLPSTSKGLLDDATSAADLSVLNIDSEDDDTISQQDIVTRRVSETSRLEESQINYQPLKHHGSTDATSMSTLNSDLDDQDNTLIDDGDGASTSCDVLSLQFDETSVAASEDLSVYCGTLKKTKKIRSKEEKQLRDLDMWQASNVEVMQHLLSRSCTLDDQIKWEAIATARGLCTLKDSCTCDDCVRAKYLAGVTDGDGGLGAAPLFNAISVGCVVQ